MLVISIFDISLILDMISNNLTTEDIFTCCRVSKTWAVLFTPYQWRSLKIDIPSPRLLHSSEAKLISSHAHLIRHLDISSLRILSALLFNPVPAPLTFFSEDNTYKTACTGLRSLVCSIDSLDGEDMYSTNRFNKSKALLELIRLNPRLQRLHINICHWRVPKYVAQVFSLLSTSSLTNLCVSTPSIFSEKVYRVILRSCPETLKYLSVHTTFASSLRHSVDEGDDEDDADGPTANLPLLPHGQQRLFSGLQELHLTGLMGIECATTIFFPLLRRCSSLSVLAVPEINSALMMTLGAILREYCPLLSTLIVYWENLFPTDLAALIKEAFPVVPPFSCRLKSLTIGGWAQGAEPFNPFDEGDIMFDALPAILDHCGPSLECLRLLDGLALSWTDFGRILTSCSTLKELSYVPPINGRYLSFAKGRSSGPLEGLASGPQWCFKDIKVLHLHVFDYLIVKQEAPIVAKNDSGVGLDSTAQEAREDTLKIINLSHDHEINSLNLVSSRSVQVWIGLLFKRLGQLVKLRELILGWESPCMPAKQTLFSWGFKEGLQHLTGLKDLEVLHLWESSIIYTPEQAARLPRSKRQESNRFWGQRERQWMKQHWPRLREYSEIPVIQTGPERF
ncbi:hypothetical protein BX616_002683 [Lobosporangium transversale]|uniref:F-box domain-containing protein n=1 Tax=Lobosporangium transversale TaxID=64571 RepID=A0A1Y2H329_9FUNG|nr:hypothetical protein BCR41DRAFT_344328 [Lobosporangium transversale]KAF9900130.1 hypothetical protein BX616_002683 [Lobosporangium transversale]ORZ28946.1 hypothetical protein BCR41DRAFT_344328 [Lobosporangium transversale]|eukprot:XP_021886619.1 hypothetical protein BCR41DRAFT_344328 [Lobosporangium transversale]